MSLFPKWQGKLSLPAVAHRKTFVGSNLVQQIVFRGGPCDVKVSDSQYPGHDLIETGLTEPYRQLLLRRKGARRLDTPIPVLVLVEDADLTDQSELRWDSLGDVETIARSPDSVLSLWQNRFSFCQADEAQGQPGLRAPQVGALHAISAHFAVGAEFEPATVVLPTGKTETMLATQVYRQLKKTLVLVPSVVLRDQIFDKFVSLGVLPEALTIPYELPGPFVTRLEAGLRSLEQATAIINQSNVIVTLPDTIRASDTQAVSYLLEHCTDLIVDEAHHVTATTWRAIRDQFRSKRILQFTATPFRRDEERIDGKIIFNFKLGDAQAAGYYRPIQLKTIEEYGEQHARDHAIASAAVAVLQRDRGELGLDHLLMARTRSKDRARDVHALYQTLAPDLNPVLVYSGSGMTAANKDALEKLLRRDDAGSYIVVCVDMLGEGFDLPNLKVAALHDTHKSLAITLQFIGRFTRKGLLGTVGDATVVTNIADPDAEAKLANLYAEGADWE